MFQYLTFSHLRGFRFNFSTRNTAEVTRGIKYAALAIRLPLSRHPKYESQLKDISNLEDYHTKYPKGYLADGTEVITEQKPANFAFPTLNIIIDDLIVPITSGAKRNTMESAAAKGQPLMTVPFIADAIDTADGSYKTETENHNITTPKKSDSQAAHHTLGSIGTP